jgi:intein/homing endonuclease
MVKEHVGPVYLEPIEHVYIHRDTGVKYNSVTKAIARIEPHFDSEAVSLAIVNQADNVKQERYIGMTQTQILDYWQMLNDEANIYGTKVHDIVERYLKANKWWFPEDELSKKVIEGYNNLNIDEGIEMQPERIMFSEEFQLAGMSDLIVDVDQKFFDVGDWKGLSVDTPIFTNNGWKTMRTLSKLDMVYDMDGNLTKILHLSEINTKPCYEITFDNNEKVIADFEHRWLISFYRNKKYKDVIMTTEELFSYLNNIKISGKRWSHKLPKVKICKPLNNDDIKLPIDPYVLGVWLGDGNSIDGKITNMRQEIWDEIELRGYNIGEDISGGGAGKAKTKTIFTLTKLLRENNLKQNKHIPDIYLNSSYSQRLDLLRGFMDADGYYNRKRKRFVMSTTRNSQALSLIQLLGSLGVKSTVLPINKKFNGRIIDVLDICFTTKNFNPFLCRNQDATVSSINFSTHKNIKSIVKVEATETRCIEVDSPTHTYLYGHTFSVTHNTNRVFNFYNPYGHETLHKPFDHLQNCQWSIYTIQLSVYAYMYEMETGKKCRQIWVGYWDKTIETFQKIQIMYLKHEARKLLELHKYNTQYK